MAKFFIDIGHRSSLDTGADGIITEEAVITDVGNLVVAKLKANGHTVQTSNVVNPSSVTDSLNQRIAQSNTFGPDLFVSLHANASTPTYSPVGTEVYYNNTTKPVAKKVVDNIAALGWKNRGTKSARLRVVTSNPRPAILIEVFFVDSKADVDLYKKVGADRLASAIVAGLEGTAVSAISTTSEKVETRGGSETEAFICRIKQYCAKKGFNTAGFLAVRLFETGGTLSAWYYARLTQSVNYVENGERLSAFGLLQWTPIGLEPLIPSLGVTSGKNRKGHIEAYRKVQKLNRQQQLTLCFEYFDFWDPITSKRTGIDRASVLYQYVLTLSPGAGPNFKDGNGVTANSLLNSKRFKAYLVQAQGMLDGTVPVPNDSPEVQVIRPDGLSTYQKINGSQKVNPSTCDIRGDYKQVSTGAATTNLAPSDTRASTSLEDKLPLKLNFTIPEYPRLINLKPGDVVVLPESATYRDWLVTSVSREFNQGINLLTVQAHRPLTTAPFIQTTALSSSNDPMAYYWLES